MNTTVTNGISGQTWTIIISIIILIAIWASKLTTKRKIWYTVIYAIIGGGIYYYMYNSKPKYPAV